MNALRVLTTVAACLLSLLVGSVTLAVAADKPLRVGGDVKAPSISKHVDVVYPEEAKTKGLEGVVLVEALIGPTGKVEKAKIKRSVLMSITVNFRIQ